MTRGHRPETRPLRDVVGEPRLHEGRGGLLGPSTSRRLRWWELTLTCGHIVERNGTYAPRTDPYRRGAARSLSDLNDPPTRARCDECPRRG